MNKTKTVSKNSNVWQYCSEVTACTNCTAFGCIWCGDESGCHEEFSPYGCITASPCDDIQHCMRKTPESLPRSDYAHVNVVATIITLFVSSVLLFGLWMIMRCVTNQRRKKIKLKQYALGDVQLERYLNEPYRPLPDCSKSDEIANVLPFDVKYFICSNRICYVFFTQLTNIQTNRVIEVQ